MIRRKGGLVGQSSRKMKMVLLACIVMSSLLYVAYGEPDHVDYSPDGFAWLGGEYYYDDYPEKGAVGQPRARAEACSVTDNDGNAWMFGGYDEDDGDWNFNDMWKYTPSTNEWRYMAGEPDWNGLGSYPDGLNLEGVPMSRYGHSCWYTSGKIWIYGGWTDYDGGSYLVDMWVYDIATSKFTFIAGFPNMYDSFGSYSKPATIGQAGHPGGRFSATVWTNKAKTGLYLHGGFGDLPGYFVKNDVWFYDTTDLTWYWKGGDYDATYWFGASFPAKGATNSVPTLRAKPQYCKDESTGNLYLWSGDYIGLDKKRSDDNNNNNNNDNGNNDSGNKKVQNEEALEAIMREKERHKDKKEGGGHHADSSKRAPSTKNTAVKKEKSSGDVAHKRAMLWLNDLWMWDQQAEHWVFLNHFEPADGEYPEGGFHGDSGVPPPRFGGAMYCDVGKGRLWNYGGQMNGYYADLWTYELERERWYFTGGSESEDMSLYPESVGDLGTPAGKSFLASWQSNGKMYFFGGWDEGGYPSSETWTFGAATGPAIVSYSPNPIPIVGGLITVVGTKFSFGDASVAVLTTKIEGRTVHKHPMLLWSNGTQAILRMPPGTGKDNTLCIDNVCTQVNYQVHYVNSLRTYPYWTPYLEIKGGNFNPNSVRVELISQQPTDNKQPTNGKAPMLNPNLGNNQAQPLCEILNVTADTIVCSVINIMKGSTSLKAVVYVNDVPIAAKLIAKLIDDQTSSCIPPRGSPDLWATDYCNCWSGYAPSTAASTDCDVRATCAERLLDAEDTFAGSSQPSAPTHSFLKDTLHIKQTIPIGLRRRSIWVNFRVPHLNNTLPLLAGGSDGAATCRYPGPLWTKTVDQLDCYDVLTASLPWSQNKFCGFVQDLDESSVEWAIYKSTMVTKFVEVYHVEGSLYQRVSSFSYLITVKFLTQKRIQSNDLAVWIADSTQQGFVKVKVNSDAVYDVASNLIYVSFTTTADWPYSLNKENSSFVNVVPAHEGVTVEIVTVENQPEITCDFSQDSTCDQKWFIRVNSNGICDVGGVYTFSSSLLCRDVNSTEEATNCPMWATPVQFSMKIAKTDLCAPKELDATEKLTAELIPYFDAEHTEPSDTYQTGDMIYWKVVVNNPQGTIDLIEFEDIEMKLIGATEGDSSSIDIMFHTGMTTQQGLAAELKTKDVKSAVAPGEPAILYMNHRVLRNALSNTVGKLSGNDQSAVELRTYVTLNLHYHGNDKRSQRAPLTVAAQRHITVIPYSQDNGDKSVTSEYGANELDQSAASSLHSSTNILFSIFMCAVFVAYTFAL